MQITMAEKFGIEGRGQFYDAPGAILDVVENHMLQVVAFLATEPPTGLHCDAIRDEQVKVFLPGHSPPTVFTVVILLLSRTQEICICGCSMRPGGGPRRIEPQRKTLACPTMKSARASPPCLAMRAIGWHAKPILPMKSQSDFITAWRSSVHPSLCQRQWPPRPSDLGRRIHAALEELEVSSRPEDRVRDRREDRYANHLSVSVQLYTVTRLPLGHAGLQLFKEYC
jgi:Glucose-6-phosphate dehydrogenase, C-terminal domain